MLSMATICREIIKEQLCGKACSLCLSIAPRHHIPGTRRSDAVRVMEDRLQRPLSQRGTGGKAGISEQGRRKTPKHRTGCRLEYASSVEGGAGLNICLYARC